MLESLIYIADRLDRSGFYRKANALDNVIRKIAQQSTDEQSFFYNLDKPNPTMSFDYGSTVEFPDTDEYDELIPDNESPSEEKDGYLKGIRLEIQDIVNTIDWEKLKEDWHGHGEDILIVHKKRAEEALKKEDSRKELYEYWFAVHNIDPENDIRGWNKMTPDNKKSIMKDITRLKNHLSALTGLGRDE